MLAKKDPYIESAYKHLRVISQDKKKRIEYEAREKAIRDYNEGMLEAQERGIAIGEERINKLYSYLIRDKRFEDLEHSTKDKDFRQQLMQQYGI